jgi:polysaccharide chain length determinant protein (PEP-CTERM system associated)
MQTDLRSRAKDPDVMDRLTEELAASLTLDKVGSKHKNTFQLSLDGRSPELVYQIVSRSLESLVESTLESARTDTASAQEFLDKQIDEYEKRLSLAEQKLAEFTRDNIGLMPDESGGYYNKLQREEGKLEDIHSELRLAQQRVFEMNRQLKGEIPLQSGSQLSNLQKYREQLQNLLTQYTENHPDVQAMRALIAETMAVEKGEQPAVVGLDDSVDLNPLYLELKAGIRDARVEVETLKVQLAEQSAKVKELKASVDLIPEIEAQLAKLNRDYDVTSKRYRSLLERRESAQLTQAIGETGSNIKFQILSQPVLSEEPSGPNRLLFMSIVFAAALAAGLGWGFLRYSLQPTFIFVRQLSNQIDLPVLGTVGLYLTTVHKIKRKVQFTSFLLVFSFLVISYGAVMYTVSGITVDDIMLLLRSSEI